MEWLGRTDGVQNMRMNATSQSSLEAPMQKRTLMACLAVAFLNCLILALMLFALVGTRALRLELNSMATRLAALEARQEQKAPLQPAIEVK